jgi:hypothetical protein
MDFKCTTVIAAPIDMVVALFLNPQNMKEWQDGFTSYELLSGTPYTPGAKAVIRYVNGNRTIVLTETILKMNLPTEMIALYEHSHGSNTMTHSFTELLQQQTRHTTNIGEIHPYGLLPKLMSVFTSGMIKKQNQKWMDQFKVFVEREIAKS